MTCLYGSSVLNLKDEIRNGADDQQLKQLLLNIFNSRAKNGWDAENEHLESPYESMSSIGG